MNNPEHVLFAFSLGLQSSQTEEKDLCGEVMGPHVRDFRSMMESIIKKVNGGVGVLKFRCREVWINLHPYITVKLRKMCIPRDGSQMGL